MAIKRELIQFTIVNSTGCGYDMPLFQQNVYSINATTKYSWDITGEDISCGTGSLVINGITYNFTYTASSLASLLDNLNLLGFGFFCSEVIGGNTYIYTTDDTNVYGLLTLCGTGTTTTTTTSTTTAAPTTTTTTTSTTTAAPTTTTTTTSTTTAAPTTTTTTTSTTTEAPTTTTTTSTTTEAPTTTTTTSTTTEAPTTTTTTSTTTEAPTTTTSTTTSTTTAGVQINIYLNNDTISVCSGLAFNNVYVPQGSYPIGNGVTIYQDAGCTNPLNTTPYSYITDQSITYQDIFQFDNLTGQVGSNVGSCP